MPPESPPHPGDQEAASNDEAHDQLGDLPFNGGEDCGWQGRAAGPPSDGRRDANRPWYYQPSRSG